MAGRIPDQIPTREQFEEWANRIAADHALVEQFEASARAAGAAYPRPSAQDEVAILRAALLARLARISGK